MTNINGLIDQSQIKNTKKGIVNKHNKKVLSFTKSMPASKKNLSKSTGYLECKEFNLKVNDLINFYDSMSNKTCNPVESALRLMKRKNEVMEAIKPSQLESSFFEISIPLSKKFKKDVEETNNKEADFLDLYSSIYDYGNCSYSEDLKTKSFDSDYEQVNYKISLPNHRNLNIPKANQLVYNERSIKCNQENTEEMKRKKFNLKRLSKSFKEYLVKCNSSSYHNRKIKKLFECLKTKDFTDILNKQKVAKNIARIKRKTEEYNKSKRTTQEIDARTLIVTKPDLVKRKIDDVFKRSIKRKEINEQKLTDQKSFSGNKTNVKLNESNLKVIETKVKENKSTTNIPMVNNKTNVKLHESNLQVNGTKVKENKSTTNNQMVNNKTNVKLNESNLQVTETKVKENKSTTNIQMVNIKTNVKLNESNLHVTETKVKENKSTTNIQMVNITPSNKIDKLSDSIDWIHYEKKEVKERKFKCEKCEISFINENAKNYHMRRSHTPKEELVEKPFKCHEEGCFRNYKTEKGLKRHKTSKHPKIY